jgi:acyl dehydratase
VEISSRFVGTPLKEQHAEVSWRETTNYAAAVADANPRYFDDERAEGLIAPPMFSVAVTWRTLSRIWEYLEDHDFPLHLLATQVHYTEHLRFHRPIRPGDTLTIGGEIAAILPHRAGTLVVIRSDAVDEQGAPVFTEHAGTLLRGVRCTDTGAGSERLPDVPRSPAPGTALPSWEATIPIEPLRPYLYDGCTGISFPIHTSPQFAHNVGLPGIILQGTATMAFAARELVDREADGNPARLAALFCRFTAVVQPGTEICVQLTGRQQGKDGTALHYVVLNGEGRRVISDGYALLHQPIIREGGTIP